MDAPGGEEDDARVGGTVGDRLAATRRRSLLGREGELGVLRRFLDDERRVLAYLHGPGGVGKTSLLDALAVDAAGAGRPVVWVDCADAEPTVTGLRQALGDRTDHGDAVRLPPEAVLIVDRFERVGQLAGWFWRSFLPRLPADVHLVVAGQRRAPESWRSDPAFAELAVVLPVRNLPPEGAAALVRARGVTGDADVAALVRATHGHPLAIVIATDIGSPTGHDGAARRGVLLDHPDAAARLLGRFLDEAITPLQRDALHVCGHTRRVDRAMLQQVLDLDAATADDLLSWLRERPYAESHPDGLTLHDVVKDALDRDLHWRDRDAFRHLHLRIRGVIVDRMQRAEGGDHDRWAGDLLHLHRGNPGAESLYAYEDLRNVVARAPELTDPEEMAWLERICESEGPAAWARFWLREQPEQWTVFEDAVGHRTGACFTGRLEPLGSPPHPDPLAAAMLEEVSTIRPPEPGEVVLTQWVLVDGNDPHRVLVVSDQAAATALRAWQVRGLGWVVFATSIEERWAPMWTYIGFERLATRTVAGRDYAIWARDFSRSPFSDWLAALAVTELDETGTAPPPVAAPVALSRADFGDAVRRLLKDLHDPVRLRRSPLLDSRLAVPGDDPAATLVGHLRRAVRCVGEAPRMQSAARVLDRTFLRPAGSQEKAAEVLGLPFSTYRRHLAAGVERLEALLWDWELHGVPADGQEVGSERAGG